MRTIQQQLNERVGLVASTVPDGCTSSTLNALFPSSLTIMRFQSLIPNVLDKVEHGFLSQWGIF
jgi:hypothetical protein